VKLCLWSAATNGPIFNPPRDVNMEALWNDIDRGITEELGEKSVTMLLCPPQIPHGLTRAGTRSCAVRSRRLTALSKMRFKLSLWSARRDGCHSHSSLSNTVTRWSSVTSEDLLLRCLPGSWLLNADPVFSQILLLFLSTWPWSNCSIPLSFSWLASVDLGQLLLSPPPSVPV
jgi:hypothetical protein